jgi:hypothetical protein
MKVYVLVQVTYCYHRFQHNYGVFESLEAAEKYANNRDNNLDVFCYNDNHDESLDNMEENHWCIQEFFCQ